MPQTVTESDPVEPVEPVDECIDVSWESRIDECTSQLQQVVTMCKHVMSENKQLRKEYLRVSRDLSKRQRKKVAKQTGGNKAPSGFAKPAQISKDLAKFLNVKPDTLLARTDVTKRINCYIKEHNLQNPENRRIIKPDKILHKLLNSGTDEVTYFNLQRYMKVHFPKVN